MRALCPECRLAATELATKIAFDDEVLNALESRAAEQAQEIARLEAQNAQLKRAMRDIRVGA